MLGGVLLALGALAFCSGSYVITTPRRWIPGDKNQLCINIQADQTTGGALSISMTTPQSRPHQKDTNVTILPRETLSIAAGQSHHCHDIRLPAGNYYRGYLTLSGRLSGASVEETVEVALRNNRNKTFIQTDKYLYQPGQEVKFRLLTVYGWKSLVSREKYSEIWVTSPSQTRIAQWKRVDNSAGLVHLAFQLADEPEEGTYTINVRGSNKVIETRTFKVEDYVLPRFVVEVTPPKYILATDERFTFRACANYTFGQPVKGKMTLEVSNNERRRCLFKYKRTEYVTGCHDFEVTAQELRFMDCSVYSVRATATMEEEGTGVTFNESVRESVRRTAVHLKAVREDAFKKPNLPYFLKVQATLPDDTPAPYVPLEVCYAGRCRNRTTGADGKVSAVVLTGDSQRIIMSTLNCRAQVQTSVFEKTLDHYFSPSNSALQIQVPEETIGCSPGKYRKHLIDILYSANNTQSALLHFQIISRGKVQKWWSRPVDFKPTKLPFDTQQLVETPPQNSQGPIVTGSVRLPITLPPTTSPTVKVLIWYTRDDGEVVSDSVELKRDRCLLHETRLTWSTSREQPGEEVTLSVQAGTDAICSVGVVDKSADLLNPDPDPINLDKIFRYLDNYNIYPWLNSQIDDFTYCQQKVFRQGGVQANSGPGTEDILPPIRRRYYSEYVDSLRMFSSSQVSPRVFSDLTLETRPCEEDVWDFYDRPYGGGGGPVYDDIPLSVGAPGIVPLSPEGPEFAGREEESSGGRKRPRTRFPETWLWDIVVLPSSGVLSQKVTLPDTITEWVGKAVCANAELGVGLSELESITSFTPFFVDLTLPPSVKRGEVLPVKISIFNYLGQPLPVTVDLLPSPEYEVVEDQTSGGAGSRRKACLAPEDKVVHTIKIRPLAIGDVNITVSAYTDTSQSSPCGSGRPVQREDTLIKPIKVEAEGFLRETTLTKYVCADELSNEPDSAVVWELSPPADIVPDSERGWVTVVGDLLALSLQNLGSLIRLPSGCGEQNMVNFAPNVYMMQYLTVTEQNTPDSTGKLLRFMRTGYQRQLLYRRSNGSYSAFGSADDSGSTWLTAFVLKSFVQAKEFIYIDDSSLNRTRAWLMASELDRSGCVVPVGKVFSKGLKGGLNGKASPVPMTAYVLIALMEAGTSANHPIVTRISQCLLGDTTRDPYTIALKAYALTLAGHPQSTVVLQQLLELAVEDDEGMRWELQRAFHRSNSLAVETAGYAILAMMEQNSEGFILDARKVVKWITTRRNGYGGFYSTQDTVVALQALASYETYAYEGKLDVVATVTAFSFRESERIQQSQQFQVKRSVETANNFVHEFTINEDNKLLQQQVSLPVFPTYVKITMEGQGCSVMQAVLRYNVPEAEPSDAFSLRVDAINAPGRDCDRKRIRACSAYLLPDGESNMAVIEVNLVSGFIPLKDDLKAVVRQNHKVVKRYEVDGSKVSFYIDEFTAEEVCVSFGILRAVKIEDTKPGSVVVYDYYEPDFAVSQSYTFPYIEECGR